mmetsp:Transcript_71903/g.220098  ORF Transcript_71903/g.220098 Transcript_71903/m.220098 type:complete len:229 (-) Transcript_71903:151-837(-)
MRLHEHGVRAMLHQSVHSADEVRLGERGTLRASDVDDHGPQYAREHGKQYEQIGDEDAVSDWGSEHGDLDALPALLHSVRRRTDFVHMLQLFHFLVCIHPRARGVQSHRFGSVSQHCREFLVEGIHIRHFEYHVRQVQSADDKATQNKDLVGFDFTAELKIRNVLLRHGHTLLSDHRKAPAAFVALQVLQHGLRHLRIVELDGALALQGLRDDSDTQDKQVECQRPNK